MKKLLLILLCLPMIGFGQDDIITYDTTYATPSEISALESSEVVTAMKRGLIGQDITILEILYFYVLDADSKKSISSSQEKDLVDNVFTIRDYLIESNKEYYLIENKTNKFLLEDSWSNKFIINAYLNSFKQKYVGKSYYPLKNEIEVKGTDYKKFILKGDELITITDIKYVKDGMIFSFDNGLMFQINIKSVKTLTQHTTNPIEGGKDGWLNLAGKYAAAANLIVEKTVLEKYVKDNSSFIDYIRDGKIKVGMTDTQMRLSWGMPYNFKKVDGYKIYNYEPQKVYVKNGKVTLIK
jgi:hypothetical protein